MFWGTCSSEIATFASLEVANMELLEVFICKSEPNISGGRRAGEEESIASTLTRLTWWVRS